jgi:hypothetical protein
MTGLFGQPNPYDVTTKLKVITNHDIEKFETDLEEFMSKHRYYGVIKTQYTTTIHNDRLIHSAYLLYMENRKK